MKQEYVLSSEMLRRIESLFDLIRVEGVPDPGEGLGPVGLSADDRKVLYLLSAVRTFEASNRASNTGHAMDLRQYNGQSAHKAASLPPRAQDSMLDETVPLDREKLPDGRNPAPTPLSSVIDLEGSAMKNQLAEVLRSSPSTLEGGELPAHASEPRPVNIPENKIVRKSIYLKNAKASETYEGAIEIDGLGGLEMIDAGGSGLSLDGSTGLLKGIPAVNGDFQIRLQGVLYGKPAEIIANLAVIPDPKSLWINKPSNRNAPFWKPDEDFWQTEGDLLCVAASKRGRSHAKDGSFRDDDFGMLANGTGGWHIAIVADGAGSANFSRRGSKVAVDCIISELPGMLEEHVTPHLGALVSAYQQDNPDAATNIRRRLYLSIAAAAFNAAKAIEEEASAMGEKASAFSTTVIITVVRQVSEFWFIAGFSIGDGAAAVFDTHDRSLTTLTLPDSGEFAGQTKFLRKTEFSGGFDDVSKRIFFDIRKDFTAVVLMTDGVSDPKFPTDSVIGDPSKWVEFWNDDLAKAVNFSRNNIGMKEQLMGWLDFWSPGNHDDRTLLVLVPSEGGQ